MTAKVYENQKIAAERLGRLPGISPISRGGGVACSSH
jgi:hypothetical protein